MTRPHNAKITGSINISLVIFACICKEGSVYAEQSCGTICVNLHYAVNAVIGKAEHSSTEGLIKTAFMELRCNKEDSKFEFFFFFFFKEKEREK